MEAGTRKADKAFACASSELLAATAAAAAEAEKEYHARWAGVVDGVIKKRAAVASKQLAKQSALSGGPTLNIHDNTTPNSSSRRVAFADVQQSHDNRGNAWRGFADVAGLGTMQTPTRRCDASGMVVIPETPLVVTAEAGGALVAGTARTISCATTQGGTAFPNCAAAAAPPVPQPEPSKSPHAAQVVARQQQLNDTSMSYGADVWAGVVCGTTPTPQRIVAQAELLRRAIHQSAMKGFHTPHHTMTPGGPPRTVQGLVAGRDTDGVDLAPTVGRYVHHPSPATRCEHCSPVRATDRRL